MSKRFNHFLNFKSLPSVGRVQVSEPNGFDSSSYKVKRDTKRFGRDVHIANEKRELTFTREHFELLNETQYLPNGDLYSYASQGFYFIKDIYENEGGEGEIEYIIQDAETEVDFITGIFDMYTLSLDFNEINVSIIQNTNRETFKRLEDTDIDAFNVKDLEGNLITPCTIHNVLIKAKPIVQTSILTSESRDYIFSGAGNGFSPFRQIAKSEIGATLTIFEDQIQWNGTGQNPFSNFSYIYAQTKLSNITVNFKLKGLATRSGGHLTPNAISLYCFKSKIENFPANYASAISVYSIDLSVDTNVNFDDTISVNINQIGIDERLYCFFLYSRISEGGNIVVKFDNSELKITATSTSIDTIAKGIRVIDLYKHAVHSIVPTMQVIAPEYDLGGEHYDNFCFNGLLLGQVVNKPFKNQYKDLNNIFRETCSDYQINENSIEVLPYLSFYNDIEMASFEQIPSNDKVTTFNPIYCLKNAEFKYNKSSSERETNSENTIDDVHTETQKLFPTKKTDNILKEEIRHIRSNFLIEEARRRAFDNEQSSSLQNDDNLIIIKCVSIPPSKKGTYNGVLSMNITDTGVLQVLNNNLNGDGINFNWGSLGILFGTQVTITSGENAGIYLVSNVITAGVPVSILELTAITGQTPPAYVGDSFITMEWAYSGVAYMNQTNEGYTLVEGVTASDNFGNLDYTWARNIKRWYPYLATASKFLLNKFITTTSFKINGNLKTQKTGESTPLGDSYPIDTTEISTLKVLNPLNHKIKVYCDFATMTQLITDIEVIKGYVTIRLNDTTTIKGYIYELDYQWITEELTLSIEEKYISDFIEIINEINIDGFATIYVDEVGKLQKSGVTSYIIDDIFVILYNERNVALNDPTRFTKFKINGINYTDKILFCEALENILTI